MPKQYLIGAIFFAASLLAAYAATPPPAGVSAIKAATDTAADTVPTQVYLQFMERESPRKLCAEQGYRSCLSVSQQRCESEVAAVAPICTAQLLKSMPDFVASKEEGRQFGRLYGKCLVVQQVTNGNYDWQTVKKCI
jgi:hypothetical protein